MNKKIDLGSLYRKLFDAYSAAYADKKKQIIQDEVNTLWKSLKNNDNIEDETESKIKELQVRLTKKKGHSSRHQRHLQSRQFLCRFFFIVL